MDLFTFAVLVLTALAAVTDQRTGRIPNVLTLPVICLAPLGHALTGGAGEALWAAVGALCCAACPFLLYARRAMGGGDLKLFLAIGALLQPVRGLEVQVAAFTVTAAYAMARLAYRGRLLPTLGGAARLALGPVVPALRRAAPAPELAESVRMGLPIFLAALGWALARWIEGA